MGSVAKISVKRPEKGKKKLSSIEIKMAANGGHIMKHNFSHDGGLGYSEPEEHSFGADEGEAAHKHLAEHIGMKMSAVKAMKKAAGADSSEGEEESRNENRDKSGKGENLGNSAL